MHIFIQIRIDERKGGLGFKAPPPLSLIFYKNFITCLAQPGILFGRGKSLTSSDFKLQLFCTKIILMSLVNFWSITTGYDVKYLLPVGIDKF